MKKLAVCGSCGKEFLAPLRGRVPALCEECRKAKVQGWVTIEEREHKVFGKVLVQKRGNKTRIVVAE
ncbi:MAG: hypothetical protein QXX30_00300 [Candidatus Aenigmatarchaeota archaeon]